MTTLISSTTNCRYTLLVVAGLGAVVFTVHYHYQSLPVPALQPLPPLPLPPPLQLLPPFLLLPLPVALPLALPLRLLLLIITTTTTTTTPLPQPPITTSATTTTTTRRRAFDDDGSFRQKSLLQLRTAVATATIEPHHDSYQAPPYPTMRCMSEARHWANTPAQNFRSIGMQWRKRLTDARTA